MHPLRLLLLVSLVIAIAVGWGLAAALDAAGVRPQVAVVLGIAVFLAFMLPWTAVSFWAVRRAGDLDELTDRTRAVAEGKVEQRIADRMFHGEVDDLARSIEELRLTLLRQRSSVEEHRATMYEIVASLGEGLIAVSPGGHVVFANRRVEDMFGSAGASVVGRTILEVVRKGSVAGVLEKALHGTASSEQVSVGSGEGERRLEVRAFPVESSPEIAAVALFIDMTTIDRLQRIRKDFLDDFSHEIRTPLAGLRSAAETLEHGGLSRESEGQLRSVMHRQIARIERLVKDLSELNQIESGEIVLQRRPVRLRGMLAEIWEEIGGAPQPLTFRLDGDDVTAFIDRPRAQQVFANLIDNAIKHAGAREISVEVRLEPPDVVVTISDDGFGIPEAELERIFNRFYRVDRSRSQPGTGLGLAIAKHLVVAHGGTIRAFNRAGGGATFEIRLPGEERSQEQNATD